LFIINRQVIAAQTRNSCSTSSIGNIGNNVKAPTPIEASDTVRQWFITMQDHTNSVITTDGAASTSTSTSLSQWDDDKYVLAWMAREASSIKDRIAQVSNTTIASDNTYVYMFTMLLSAVNYTCVRAACRVCMCL
jgi:hypothetical protein